MDGRTGKGKYEGMNKAGKEEKKGRCMGVRVEGGTNRRRRGAGRGRGRELDAGRGEVSEERRRQE